MPRDLRPNSPLSPFACLCGSVRGLGAAVSIAVALASSTGASAQSGELLSKLNAPWVRISESARSANRLFTAYLDMTKSPQEIGEEFNQTAIYPGMDGWEAVAAWAEANGSMGQTLIGLQDCQVLGVPYGTEGVDPRFVERGLVALIGVEGDLTRVDFPYLPALETINAYVAADLYRLCEAGKFEDALILDGNLSLAPDGSAA
jgi:hypothetical protein